MRALFVKGVILQLISEKVINRDDSILAVCADKAEHNLFRSIGFNHVLITGLNPELINRK